MRSWRIKKVLFDDRASEIAEAALVLPLAFMVLLGIYWFGRAFNTYATINDAAREGARVAVAQKCATCGNTAPTPVAIATAVTQTLQASSVDPGQIIQYPTTTPTPAYCPGAPAAPACSVSGNITICTDMQLQTPPAAGGSPACGVAVSFRYPYQFWLPFTSLNNQQIILTADVQMAGEY